MDDFAGVRGAVHIDGFIDHQFFILLEFCCSGLSNLLHSKCLHIIFTP